MMKAADGISANTAVYRRCLSNTKQTGQILLLYAEDHSGWLLPAVLKEENKTYFNKLTNLHYAKSPKPFVSGKSVHIPAVFKCPDSRLIDHDGFAYGLRVNNQSTNACINLTAQKPLRSSGSAPYLASSITWKSAQELLLLGDSLPVAYKTNGKYMQHYYLGDNNNSQQGAALPHFRHLGKCSMLYGDGHVKGIQQHELGDSVKPHSGWTWFNQYNVIQGSYP